MGLSEPYAHDHDGPVRERASGAAPSTCHARSFASDEVQWPWIYEPVSNFR
jgi:hypothetical protein